MFFGKLYKIEEAKKYIRCSGYKKINMDWLNLKKLNVASAC